MQQDIRKIMQIFCRHDDFSCGDPSRLYLAKARETKWDNNLLLLLSPKVGGPGILPFRRQSPLNITRDCPTILKQKISYWIFNEVVSLCLRHPKLLTLDFNRLWEWFPIWRAREFPILLPINPHSLEFVGTWYKASSLPRKLLLSWKC